MSDLKELLGPVNDYYEGQVLEDIANKILTGKLSDITENEIFLLQTEVEVASRSERIQAVYDKLEESEQELINEINERGA
tara:strand:- start:398 stop:637 length:240 start_codon:yes stop_codon:yes gene_type:complete